MIVLVRSNKTLFEITLNHFSACGGMSRGHNKTKNNNAHTLLKNLKS